MINEMAGATRGQLGDVRIGGLVHFDEHRRAPAALLA
jgi:hypothetical protein